MASRHITLGLQTPLKKGYSSIYKKNLMIMSLMNSYIIVRKNVAKVINYLLNHSGVTSTNTMCQMSFFFSMLLHCFALHLVSRVMLPRAHGASMGYPLASQVGQLCSDQMSYGPLPIQKSTIESTFVVCPPMPRIICVLQTCDGLSRVLFTL